MAKTNNNEKVIWTPQMPDRRKNDRRGVGDIQTTGKSLNISDMKNGSDRRTGTDRRKKISVTITGRAIEVEQKK